MLERLGHEHIDFLLERQVNADFERLSTACRRFVSFTPGSSKRLQRPFRIRFQVARKLKAL